MAGGRGAAAVMNLASRKAGLRSELKRRAAGIDPARLPAWNHAVAERLFATAEWAQARSLAAYASLPGEPSTDGPMREFLARGGRVACLRYDGDRAVYRPAWIRDVDRDLHAGRFGIREPGGSPVDSPASFDMALLPGLGFDRLGRRLGRGRGYIDEFCAWLGPGATRVALAFSWQVVGEVPAGPGDELMDVVITDRETIRVASARPAGAEAPR